MATSFSKISKPWPKDVCRRRYVEGGDNIGLRGLAEESGRAKSTLQDWSKELIDGLTWLQQRVRFTANISTAVQQRTVDKTSEKLSDELSDIAIANYKAHKLARDYAFAIFQIKAKHLKEIQGMENEKQIVELKKHSGNDMNYWSLIMTRSTQEIAAAVGLPYFVNANSAYKKLEQEGYVILDPQGEQEEGGDR